MCIYSHMYIETLCHLLWGLNPPKEVKTRINLFIYIYIHIYIYIYICVYTGFIDDWFPPSTNSNMLQLNNKFVWSKLTRFLMIDFLGLDHISLTSKFLNCSAVFWGLRKDSHVVVSTLLGLEPSNLALAPRHWLLSSDKRNPGLMHKKHMYQ